VTGTYHENGIKNVILVTNKYTYNVFQLHMSMVDSDSDNK